MKKSTVQGKRSAEDLLAAIDKMGTRMDDNTVQMGVKLEQVARLITDLRALAAELYAAGGNAAGLPEPWDKHKRLKKKAEALGVRL